MSTLNTQHPCDGIGCIQRASWKCECWTLHVKPKQAVTYWCDKHAEELKAEQKDANSIWYRLAESPQPSDHQKQREENALSALDKLRQSEIEELKQKLMVYEEETAKDLPNRFLMYINCTIGTQLLLIRKRADKARRDPRMHGHHCDMRAALDSIYDLATVNAKAEDETFKRYNTMNLSELDKVKAELSQTKEELARVKDESARGFDRGYFCACAVLIKEDGETTNSISLLRQGGQGWRNMDAIDLETIKEEGMLAYLKGAIKPMLTPPAQPETEWIQ